MAERFNRIKSACLALGMVVFATALLAAQDTTRLTLPRPEMDKGKPLMQALKERKSARVFSNEKLPLQEVSNLLWAAFGINRPETNGRTAPSAMNAQEIDVYAAMAEGLFLYDAKANALKKISGNDIRALAGKQPFVKDAPLNLIYVADYARTKSGKTDDARIYAAADAGFIAENAYLYCASAGLATVVRGSIDKSALAVAMGLAPTQEIILSQTIGYPKK